MAELAFDRLIAEIRACTHETGLSLAGTYCRDYREAKAPASLMVTQSAEDETSPHTRCCGRIGLVTNNRCTLQTTLMLHKRLQHFTATKFLVHTRVTLAN